jgi:hypothetical protein
VLVRSFGRSGGMRVWLHSVDSCTTLPPFQGSF